MRARDSKKTTLAVVLASLMAVLLWYATRNSTDPGAIESPTADVTGHPAALGTDELARSTTREATVTPTGEAVEPIRRVPIHGRVLDDVFGIPIAARLVPDTGERRWSDSITGRFALESECTSLRSIAAGFDDVVVEGASLRADEGIEIRMHARKSAAVLVERDDGTPVEGLSVAWRAAIDPTVKLEEWLDARRHRQGRALASRTDAAGRSSIAAACESMAVVSGPARVDGPEIVTRTVRVLPGEEVRVTWTRDVLLLRFVEASSEKPVAALELQSWLPREPSALAESLVTDDEGRVAIAASSWPVFVRRPAPYIFQGRFVTRPGPHAPTLSPSINDMCLRFEKRPSEDVATIELHPGPGRVRLVDDATGDPVNAWASVMRLSGEPPQLADPPRPSRHCIESARYETQLAPRIEVRDGLLEMSRFLGQALAKSATSGGLPLRIAVEGYAPVDWTLTPAAASGEPQILRLKNAEPRRLRVVQAGERPFQGAVHVYTPDPETIYFSACGDREGNYGPFDAYGGDVYVSFDETRTWHTKFSAAEVAAHEVLTIELPAPTGRIVVEGIPTACEGVALVAKSRIGAQEPSFEPTSSASDRCEFAELPPGSYMVGPIEWVLGAEKQSVEAERMDQPLVELPMRCVVRPGETTIVRWNPVWCSGVTMEGQVRVLGTSRPHIALFPLYGPIGADTKEAPGAPPRLVFGRASRRIPMDAQGRYRILATDPVPRLIAVCEMDEVAWGSYQGMHLLETLRPGESIDVPTGSVELRWVGQPRKSPFTVTYTVPIEALRHPLQTSFSRCQTSWDTSRPLRLDVIPTSVDKLEFLKRTVPIHVEPGHVQTIDVEPAALGLSDG